VLLDLASELVDVDVAVVVTRVLDQFDEPSRRHVGEIKPPKRVFDVVGI
jgi:hypothetical protein